MNKLDAYQVAAREQQARPMSEPITLFGRIQSFQFVPIDELTAEDDPTEGLGFVEQHMVFR